VPNKLPINMCNKIAGGKSAITDPVDAKSGSRASLVQTALTLKRYK